jgi:1,4-dihydroxy-6-naphthoate synthase
METMNQILSLGYSPCPNDTFIFFGLAEGRVRVEPYQFDIFIADVEALNRKARGRQLDVTKISIFALLHLLDEYWLLRAGGALGRGCGPLVVARQPFAMEDLQDKVIAIPGKMTTAHLLLQLHGIHRGPRVEMPFDRIMPAVANGDVDAGVIIHEGRFTYPAMGLREVVDLGAWWEKHAGLPLPLGGIIMKRSLGAEAARTVEAKIRESLTYSRAHPDAAWPYIKGHAQEMEPDVIHKHIDTFVNDFSFDVGKEGEKAVTAILKAAFKLAKMPFPDLPIFRD